jgi:spermidine/putrescine transport system ATP-binding protein
MTMADSIAVMNAGHIEQLGTPEELYDLPRTAFVAEFLGVSNLLQGSVAGIDTVRLEGGGEIRVLPEALEGRSGPVAVGVRPENIRLGSDAVNRIDGRVVESAYEGVATQYDVETAHGRIQVYAQNVEPGARSVAPGDGVTLSFSPDVVFVVE